MKPITQYSFPSEQYIKTETEKTQIYLHHTAGNANPFATFDGWTGNPERIATCVVIGGRPGDNGKWQDGQIVQGFSSKFWAYHLGLKEQTFNSFGLPYKSLDKISIGIEVCNWGQLTKKDDGTFWNYVNRQVPESEVCELAFPFRGYKYYHAYTDQQIDSIRELLIYWKGVYNIPIEYNEEIWDVTPKALSGKPGVYTHNSVRRDKNDVSPQPKLIAMLQSL